MVRGDLYHVLDILALLHGGRHPRIALPGHLCWCGSQSPPPPVFMVGRELVRGVTLLVLTLRLGSLTDLDYSAERNTS